MRKNKPSIIVIVFFLFVASLNAQENTFKYLTDVKKAKLAAQTKGVPILMVFAGSDWCRPCIQFKKKILETQEFKSFSTDSIVLLYLDFPSKKQNKLTQEQKEHNEKLAERFNKQGVFPKIILVDSTLNKLGELQYLGQKPTIFIKSIKKLRSSNNSKLLHAKKKLILMGCKFELTAVGLNEQENWRAIEVGIGEIRRIEQKISSWDESSMTSKVNQSAGIRAIKVDDELYGLLFRAKKLSKLTNGAFDVSFAAVEKMWHFDKRNYNEMDSAQIKKAKEVVNWKHIILNPTEKSVFLKEKGMRIGLGAIGKGYAANMAKKKMKEFSGIRGGVVNASGDLLSWGVNSNNESWSIQIANPKNAKKAIGWLSFKEHAIATSGDYEKYFMYQGKRFAHIIDPRTGYPTTGLVSVTVLSPDAEICDALATSVFVLGKKEGLKLINTLDGIECLIIDEAGEITTSTGLNLNYYK